MMPDYQEVAHTPLFIWDPRLQIAGEHRKSLVQTIDLAPTLLEFFGVEIPKDMLGKPLRGVMETDSPVREYGIFGSHSGVLSVTDGKYVLMVAPKDKEGGLYNYTLMTTHMRSRMSVEELQQASLAGPFSFTKGCRVLKIPAICKKMSDLPVGGELVFDVAEDPKQEHPLEDNGISARLKEAMIRILEENDAPAELYDYYGLK